MTNSVSTSPVLVSRLGQFGRLTLNRPEALHALNEEMCATMLTALRGWRDDPDVFAVLIDHAEGTRGFCAGGDIRMLAESGAGDGQAAYDFFATEYRLNTLIKRFPKPIVAFMDGVTMGGGVGISVHGTHRVATERTVFAMPETGIGLFPDVGGSWFLPRLQGYLGTWLALTGVRLKGPDVKVAGVATHFVPAELLGNLRVQLAGADLSAGAAEMVSAVVGGVSHAVVQSSFGAHTDTINRCFSNDTAEEIVAALRSEESEWATAQADMLATKSPQTIKVALRQMREGVKASAIEDVMQMEYRIARRVVHRHDFLEGVRAVIIEKDNAPKWSPSRLEDVPDSLIDEIFAPLGDAELDLDA